ncbi:MAG: Wzz/FepE/Etk N-terminal domain-containing protein [Candidatus Sulfotelmatobacter sp.]
MENRELTMDDYLAMFRRRAKLILIPALLAPLAGFGVSYFFPAKYTSESLVSVEESKISDAVVPQVYNEDLTQHLNTMKQLVLSADKLRAMVQRLGLAKEGQNADDLVATIQGSMQITPVPDLSQFGSAPNRKRPGQSTSIPGFYVNYTAPSAEEAKKICAELTSMLLAEDYNSRKAASQSTTDFLTTQVEQAKQKLDDLDKQLAAFKKQYMGQLPGDEDNNLKILMGLNSQLDANTQTLSRAQQDKSYTESLLAQQISAWKTSQSSSNPQTLQQQLSQLQAQLIDLQARYTPDHPDVIKTQADIAQVRKKLDEINNDSGKETSESTAKGAGSEPPEIRQLRLQVHQYEDLIAQASRDQKKLQQEISMYQGRIALSPAVEEQYKQLAREYDNTQKVYQDDLAKQSASQMASQAQKAEGEQMTLLNAANLPDSPSFPIRPYFAGGGLGAGLALGIGLALWLELRDKSIRTQADAEVAVELPMLVAMPWVVETEPVNGNGKGRLWNRKKPEEKETVKY